MVDLFFKNLASFQGVYSHHGPNKWTSPVPIDFLAGHCGPKKVCRTNMVGCSAGERGCIFVSVAFVSGMRSWRQLI